MMRRSTSWLAVLAIALGGFPSATAQPAPEIQVGGTVHGELGGSGLALLDGARFEVYSFTARKGERYQIDLHSAAFQPILTLMRPVGPISEWLRSSEDGGGDARLWFNPPADGTFLVVVSAEGIEGEGPFSLTLQQVPPPPPAVPRPIAAGQSVEDALAVTDPIFEGSRWETFYHLYAIDGRAGQQLLITMDSDEFDAFLEFGPLHGNEVEVTDFDDDGGAGTNARLLVTLPNDGTYGILARSFAQHEVGAYSLAVSEYSPKPARVRPLPADRRATGVLDEGDAELEDRGFLHEWTFSGQAGETVRIRMRSEDFDTYLFLGRVVDGRFEELAFNDDAPDDGTNSLIVYELPWDGEYVIRATSFHSGVVGEYSLTVE